MFISFKYLIFWRMIHLPYRSPNQVVTRTKPWRMKTRFYYYFNYSKLYILWKWMLEFKHFVLEVMVQILYINFTKKFPALNKVTCLASLAAWMGWVAIQQAQSLTLSEFSFSNEKYNSSFNSVCCQAVIQASHGVNSAS